MSEVNVSSGQQSTADEHGYLMAYDKKERKAKGVTGIDANGDLMTAEADEVNRSQFVKIDQHGNFFTNFGKNFMYQYNNPTGYSLYNMPKETPVEQAKEKIEAAQEPQNEHLRRELSSKRIYNHHRFNEREIDWKKAEKYGITPDSLRYGDDLERILQGRMTSRAYRIGKESEVGRENGDAKLSLFRDQNGEVKFDIHYIRQAVKPGDEYRGLKLSEEDLKQLNRTGNLGRTADLVVDYRTGETKSCYVSKDPITHEMFHLQADKVNCARQIKGHVFTPDEYNTVRNGGEVEITFQSGGKEYTSAIQISAAERGLEFLWERGNKQRLKQEVGDETELKNSPDVAKQAPVENTLRKNSPKRNTIKPKL